MVEVDVFWAYGIGAGFALAAAQQLKLRAAAQPAEPVEPQPQDAGLGRLGRLAGSDGFLLSATLYCAALFAPSGAWLLWAYPSWETMHAGDRNLPAWLVALFAATNTTQGVLGYLVTKRLLLRGRDALAGLQMLAAYFGLFFILVHGWDGVGYQRFFSFTRADFETWSQRPVLTNVGHWCSSPVAITLYLMGVVMLPLMWGTYQVWHRAGRRVAGLPAGAGTGWAFQGAVQLFVWGYALGFAVLASVAIHLLGPAFGIPVDVLLAVAACVPERGPVRFVTHRWLLPRRDESLGPDPVLSSAGRRPVSAAPSGSGTE